MIPSFRAMKCLLPILTLALAPVCSAQSTSLQVGSPGFYTWGDPGNWDNGVPGASDDVLLGMQTLFDDPFNVQVFIVAPASVSSITMESGVGLTVQDTSLTVQGVFDAQVTSSDIDGLFQPHLAATNSQVTLGEMTEYDHATGALYNDLSFLIHSEGGGNSYIQWPNADIRSLQTIINLSGPNSRFRDQSGQNALRNLRKIGGGTAIDDRFGLMDLYNHTLNLTGNLVNDGEIHLRAGSVINVAGTISGNGKFLKGEGGGRITAAGFTATGITFETLETPDVLPFEFESPAFNLTNSTVRGRIKLTGSVTTTGTTYEDDGRGGQAEITGPHTATNGCLQARGVDSFTLKAQHHSYSTTKSAGNWNLGGRVRWQDGSIHPGNSPGTFRVQDGDFELSGNPTIGMELGGRAPGTGHDVIIQSGGPIGTTLAGTLQITFIDRFECEVLTADSFTILTSDRPLLGAFGNVASGARIATTDGSGSFLVRYGTGAPAPNAVTLSDFQPVIVPETYAQWVARHAIPVGQTGPTADPNGDGISNAVAFATGLSPVGPGESSPFMSELTPAGVVVSFLAPKSALGLTVTSATSTDLTTWPVGTALTAVPYSALKNRYSFTLPLTGSDRRFGRFNISVP